MCYNSGMEWKERVSADPGVIDALVGGETVELGSFGTGAERMTLTLRYRYHVDKAGLKLQTRSKDGVLFGRAV